MQGAPEELLIVFSLQMRIIIGTIIWPIVIVGLVGNVAVFLRILFTETTKTSILKPFYRCALLSLATSDLLLLATSGTNTLISISHKTILWSLPDWCCNLVPYLQTVAVLVASLTLAGVAIDRYAAIRLKYPLSKGLKWHWAIGLVTGIWAVAFGASYPVLGTYTAEPIFVISSSTFYMGTLCINAIRSEAFVIYTALFAVIFVPLGTVFILVHVLLARNIWQRNRPGDNVNQQATNNGSQFSNENSTVSTSLGKPRHVATKKIGPLPSYVARKRRTVRVILALIIIFLICRLPHWAFLIFKLYATTAEDYWWYIQIVLTSLSLLNAAVHPFLYVFLNEALSLVTWIRAWCTRTRVPPATTIRPISEEEIRSTISAKVPRGPYHSP